MLKVLTSFISSKKSVRSLSLATMIFAVSSLQVADASFLGKIKSLFKKEVQPFSVTSPQFKEGQLIPEDQVWDKFGCSGKNISPEINIRHIPDGTKSFAVTIFDPDAPSQSGWWHLVLYNIPLNMVSIPANFSSMTLAEHGVLFGTSDGGGKDYVGPCPPEGREHRYVLTAYALNKKLDVSDSSTSAEISANIIKNSIAKSQIIARYKRS